MAGLQPRCRGGLAPGVADDQREAQSGDDDEKKNRVAAPRRNPPQPLAHVPGLADLNVLGPSAGARRSERPSLEGSVDLVYGGYPTKGGEEEADMWDSRGSHAESAATPDKIGVKNHRGI
uniref:Uncharacterized protein n=1 Tax=Oryza glumipatula TaxID=40148 RepID=A0A0D9Z3G4_9ORYZ